MSSLPRLPLGNMGKGSLWALVAAACTALQAAPVHLVLDSASTRPRFEADAGMTTLEGRATRAEGEIVLDRAAGQGSVRVRMAADSLDFGWGMLNELARGPSAFDAQRFPDILYTGQLAGFVDGKPTQVDGELQMHGITRPLTLALQGFECAPASDAATGAPGERCRAEAQATLQRDEFGITLGRDLGLGMAVTLRIHIEALSAPEHSASAPPAAPPDPS